MRSIHAILPFLFLLLLPRSHSTATASPKPSKNLDHTEALLTALESADLQSHLTALLSHQTASSTPQELLKLAEHHIKTRDTKRAIKLLRLSALLGSDDAHATAGALLLSGDAELPRNLPAAVTHLTHAAKRGQPDAQALLGFLHASGIADRWGIEKNAKKALLNWAFSAAGGNVFAMTALAFRYRYGIGVPASCEISARYYRRAAKAIASDSRHWPSAENFLRGRPPLPSTLSDSGRLRLDENVIQGKEELHSSEPDLIQFYRHSAEKGDVSAMTTLGGLQYFGGYGLDPDEEAARELLEMAARNDGAEAHGMLGYLDMRHGRNDSALLRFRYSAASSKIGHYALGMVFFHGLLGMEQDYSKAEMHFKLATEQRHPEASFHLGLIYGHGLGVEKNADEAFRHFQDGARGGNIQSMFNVGSMLLDGSGPVKQKNCALALKSLKSVAEQGEWRTLFDIAVSAIEEKDWFTSIYRHLQAAHAGIEIAQFNAAILLELGNATEIPELQHWGRERFLNEAHELYEYSGIQGYTNSFIRSGHMHYEELHAYETAVHSYEKAVWMNDTEGMVTLAMMHARGLGIPENRTHALTFLDKAQGFADGQLPAFVARIVLWFYWTFSDIYDQLAPIFMKLPETRVVPRPPTQQAIGASENVRRTTGISVIPAMIIVEELAIVGALFAILVAVLFVRSNRLARQQAEHQVS